MAQWRDYTVAFENVAVAAAQDFFELTPADDKPIEIYGIFFYNLSVEGDANMDQFRWSVIRGHTTSGSGGTTATPRPLGRSDTTAGFTAEVNNTTIASVGTTHVLHAGGWNILSDGPNPNFLPEGAGWGASQADVTIVVRLASTPDASTTMSGTLYVREYG